MEENIKQEYMERSSAEPEKPEKRGKLWIRIVKWTAGIVLGILLLLTGIVSVAVWILTPERLTPLVERYGSEYLDADVSADRIELTFWHTFPHLTLEIDSLNLTARNVPEEYSCVFSVDHLHGTVNILSLLKYSVELRDLYIGHPQATLAVFEDGKTNFDIFPAPEPDTVKSKASVPPPSIGFDRFLVENAGPIRYISLKDSTDICVNVSTINLGGKDVPLYTLSVSADGKFASPVMKLDKLTLGLDGKIRFDLKRPDRIELDDMTVAADSLRAEFSTALSFRDTLCVDRLKFAFPEWSVNRILTLLPDKMKEPLTKLDTDMKFTAEGELKEPYNVIFPEDSTAPVPVPAVKVRLEIPECHVSYGKLELRRIELEAEAETTGKSLDDTRIEVSRFIVAARNLGLGMKGIITSPVSDPRFNGTVRGEINFDNLPPVIYSRFASAISGRVKTDISVRASIGDLNPRRFHRIYVDGTVDLLNLRYSSADSLTGVYTSDSRLRFGSNVSLANSTGAVVDSLLSVSVKGDTMAFRSGPTLLSLARYTVGAGTKVMKNRADSAIIPFGGVVRFSRLRLTDKTDSVFFAMRDAGCKATIRSSAVDNRKPLIDLEFDNRFMFGGTPAGRVALTGAHIDLHASYRERAQVSDSIRAARIARQRAARERGLINEDTNESDLDLEVDSGLKKLLNRWNISGHIRAKGGRGFLKSMPAANVIRNVDLSFNTDSVVLRNFSYNIGNSDFLVNGVISNIRRALTRKRNNTIKIDVDIASDTVDVNFLSALSMSTLSADDIPVDEDQAEKMTATDIRVNSEHADSLPMEPILIPGNLDGVLRLRADNLIYTDFDFKNFRGDVRIRESVAQLRDLSASSDIGTLSLTALYSAPSTSDIEFGMGMKVNNFHIDKMIKLIPAIDSLMPLIKDFSGIINADLAATAKVDSTMNIDIPSLQAALKLSGDSLVLLDADTFKSLSKWLMFKNKKRNMIDKMEVEMVVDNSTLEIFPFIFDIDRYRLGVMGSNDLNMNLNYHISVLKSPMPFKFGINIKGNIDNPKIRLGGAKFKNNTVIERVSIADTTRVNLVNQIENIFRRSARTGLKLKKPQTDFRLTDEPSDTLDAAEKLILEGNGAQ